ncbi:MAG TPA: hypothetical protein VN778_00330 [Verrucomicrobiae bacterium]|nr:hypothetical protein [Verrucomicrobiae bacterium]
MIRLETQQLSGFNDTLIDEPAHFEVTLPNGQVRDYDAVIGNTPAVTSEYDAYDQPQLVLQTEVPDVLPWDEEVHYPAGRLASFHGRTLEILAGKVAVEDQFGNHYQSVSIKGSDFSDPHIFSSETASRGFIIHGLQESLVLERVIRASRLLREHGIPAEYICGLVIPDKFPMHTDPDNPDTRQLVPLPELVEALAADYAQEELEESRTPLEVKADMIEKLHDVDYLITYRAMDAPYRFGELADPDTLDEFYDFLIRQNDDPNLHEYLEELHPMTYIVAQFAVELGINVAKMHKLGVSHGFLHSENITALGSFVDLDSCRGEPLGLGDDPITDKDIYKDIVWAMRSLVDVLDGWQPSPHDDINGFLDITSMQVYAREFFLTEYLKERSFDKSAAEAFLTGLVSYQQPKRTQHYGSFARFCEVVTGAYCSFIGGEEHIKDVNEEDMPSIENYDLHYDRKDTVFRAAPARFFKEFRDRLLSNNWSRNHEYESLHETDKPLHSLMKAAIRSDSLRFFVRHAEQSGLIDEPALFMAALTMGSSITNVDPENVPNKNQALHQYFVRQGEKMVEQLGDEYTQYDKPVMEFLLNKSLGDLKKQTGILDWENGAITSLLYLNGATQYERIFKALDLQPQSKITYINVGEAMRRAVNKQDDTILILDYGVAEFIAETPRKDDLWKAVFGYRHKFKPLILIEGLLAGEPEICLVHYEELEDARYKNLEGEEGDNEEPEKLKPELPETVAGDLSLDTLRQNRLRLFSTD